LSHQGDDRRDLLERLFVEVVSQMHDPIANAWRPLCFPSTRLVAPNHVLGPHDLIGRPFLQHAVLMDAASWARRSAHDRFVAWTSMPVIFETSRLAAHSRRVLTPVVR